MQNNNENVNNENVNNENVNNETSNNENNIDAKEIDKKLFEEFITESRENLVFIDGLLSQEKIHTAESHVLSSYMRIMHSIKGISGFVGILNLSEFTHILEDLVVNIQNNKLSISDEVIDIIFKGLDFSKNILERSSLVPSENYLTDEEKSFMEEIHELIYGKKVFKIQDVKVSLNECINLLNSIEKDVQPESLNEFAGFFNILNNFNNYLNLSLSEHDQKEVVKINFSSDYLYYLFFDDVSQNLSVLADTLLKVLNEGGSDDCFALAEKNLLTLLEKKDLLNEDNDIIKYLNNMVTDLPILKNPEIDIIKEFSSELFSNFNYLLSNLICIEKGYEQVIEDLKIQFSDKSIDFEKLKELVKQKLSEIKKEKSKTAQPVSSSAEDTERYIRVPQSTIDKFMFSIGSLIIKSDWLNYFYKYLIKYKSVDTNQINNYRDNIVELNKMIGNLEDDLMAVRKVPIGTSLNKYYKLVRDVSGKVNKKVQLMIEGGDVCIDTSVFKEIDPVLVHVIRNSIDHGIENPEIRKDNDKSETGTITLKTVLDKSNIIISVIDDGAGINVEKVKQKAIDKKIVSKEEADNLSQDEIIDFIFQEGFSSAEEVTDISGRGVGLEILSNTMQNLNGDYKIQTVQGKGSTFELVIPQISTLVTKKALIIKSGKNDFAFLNDDIENMIKITSDDFTVYKNNKMIHYNSNIIPVYYLNDLLKLDTTIDIENADSIPVIITKSSHGRIGIIVDDFKNYQTIVVKKFEHNLLFDIRGITGFTLAGSGEIILIFSVEEFFFESEV